MGRVGVAPTVFLMCLIYSQVPSLLGIPAHNKTVCVEILQTDGLQSMILFRRSLSMPLFYRSFFTRQIDLAAKQKVQIKNV